MDKIIEKFLLELGLSSEEAQLYLMLVKNGTLTVLELSRLSSTNRTRVYRLLEKLQKDGFVEIIVDENRQLVTAADVNALDMLVAEQEAKTAYLRDSLSIVTKSLETQLTAHDPQTTVLFYKGENGIRQMVWHTLKANKVMYSYTNKPLEEMTGSKMARRWQEEWIKQRLVFMELYSDELKTRMDSKRNERINEQKSPSFISRYIPSSQLAIDHQIDIYNDVIAYYNRHEGEIFGVEIHNKKVANLQRQLFLLAWDKAM